MSAEIIVADDHDLARSGLVAMLADQPDFRVVREARDGSEAVALAAEIKPDLILMDIRMPGKDGLAAAREIRTLSPGSRILMITMHDSLDYLEAAIDAGASGYILKEASRSEILRTIRLILEGDSFFDASLVGKLLKRVNVSVTAPSQKLSLLTPREHDVLRSVVEGLTNKEIGRRLDIAPGTVKVHVERILGKLGVSDRTQAAVLAVRYGLKPNSEGQAP